jgi:hypothetical protein
MRAVVVGMVVDGKLVTDFEGRLASNVVVARFRGGIAAQRAYALRRSGNVRICHVRSSQRSSAGYQHVVMQQYRVDGMKKVTALPMPY